MQRACSTAGEVSLAASAGSLHHPVSPWPAPPWVEQESSCIFRCTQRRDPNPPGARGICKCLVLIPSPCCEVFICDKDFHSNRLISLAGLWSPWKSRWKEGMEKAQHHTKWYEEADTGIYVTQVPGFSMSKLPEKGNSPGNLCRGCCERIRLGPRRHTLHKSHLPNLICSPCTARRS